MVVSKFNTVSLDTDDVNIACVEYIVSETKPMVIAVNK